MKKLTYLLYIVGTFLVVIGAFIMTDIGQMLKVKKESVVWFYEYGNWVIIVSGLIFFAGVYLAGKTGIQKKKGQLLMGLLWVLAVLVTKTMTPYLLFPAQQNEARYVAINETGEDYLADDDRVLVINYNGVQKAYPAKYIWQSHIFGGDYAGDEVIFTYCIMTNLASPYINDIDGKKGDFKVLAQTNNNLLIWDKENDDIIQQITQECEFSKKKLDLIPVYEMTYRGYKKLFPNGDVLFNKYDSPMEKFVDFIFDVDAALYGEEFMFKTSNFEDTRFPFKEHVIGIRDDENNAQLALSKDYIKENGIIDLKVGGKNLIITYFPDYETIAAFNKGEFADSTITDINPLGESNYGQLEQEYIYNSVYWSVWAYYYPETQVLK